MNFPQGIIFITVTLIISLTNYIICKFKLKACNAACRQPAIESLVVTSLVEWPLVLWRATMSCSATCVMCMVHCFYFFWEHLSIPKVFEQPGNVHIILVTIRKVMLKKLLTDYSGWPNLISKKYHFHLERIGIPDTPVFFQMPVCRYE